MNIIDASCASCGAAPPLKIRQPERDERVEALLKTNGVPQDIERPALEEYARGAPLALLQYDAKITALKQELELAVRERAKLQRHYEDAKTLLHPIRTLPSDVLREVFSWCIPTRRELFEDIKEDTFDYCSLNASNAPWSLSQVSKGWRTVALSSPLLWRTVALTVPDNSIRTSKLGKFGFNLALLLSRSNNADLHVILECPPDKVKLVPFAVSIPLQISASRWQSLFYDNNPILERVLSDMHFDRLQSVDVRCSQRTEDSKVAPIRYAPQLWQVSLLYGGTTVLRTIAWDIGAHDESCLVTSERFGRHHPHLPAHVHTTPQTHESNSQFKMLSHPLPIRGRIQRTSSHIPIFVLL
ncbi:hypothetical protein BDZ89DRAFT_251655 [Hymenopellis radicata]|nr:hypothetical protein BDZ89DRAFT_251655 [Hymenopellis radicata]